MEPALTALLFLPRIPGYGQCLQAAVREFHQVLLQWVYPEGVADFKVPGFPVRSFGVNKKPFVLFKETAGEACVSEGAVVKITQHRIHSGQLHGQVMVGITPAVKLLLVTVFTTPVVNKSVCRSHGSNRGSGLRLWRLLRRLFTGRQDQKKGGK